MDRSPRCNQTHAMELRVPALQGRLCDLCRSSTNYSPYLYNCPSCGFDLCPSCTPGRATAAPSTTDAAVAAVVKPTWSSVVVKLEGGGVAVAIADGQSAEGFSIKSAEEVPIGVWTHVAYTVDISEKTISLYVNGTVSSTQTLPDALCEPRADINDHPVFLGQVCCFVLSAWNFYRNKCCVSGCYFYRKCICEWPMNDILYFE